jgi:hypothetical protein
VCNVVWRRRRTRQRKYYSNDGFSRYSIKEFNIFFIFIIAELKCVLSAASAKESSDWWECPCTSNIVKTITKTNAKYVDSIIRLKLNWQFTLKIIIMMMSTTKNKMATRNSSWWTINVVCNHRWNCRAVFSNFFFYFPNFFFYIYNYKYY